MTYFEFLLIFIIPLVALGSMAFRKTNDPEKVYVLRGIILLAVLAVVYTTPWDNYLIMTHVWSYEDHRVLGKIGYVPIEEYAFFVLQSFLSGYWCYFVQRWIPIQKDPSRISSALIFAMSASLFGIFTAGIYLLNQVEGRYMGLILVWALPVIILQWLVGARFLLSNLRTYLWSLLPATIYLCTVDAIAIHLKVWKISMQQTTGIFIFNLPIEEALFFLLTNVMLVQGLVLFIAMKERFPILTRRIFLRG